MHKFTEPTQAFENFLHTTLIQNGSKKFETLLWRIWSYTNTELEDAQGKLLLVTGTEEYVRKKRIVQKSMFPIIGQNE